MKNKSPIIVSPISVVNEFRMKKLQKKTDIILLVEGASDVRLYRQLSINSKICMIKATGGKSLAIEILKIFESDENLKNKILVIIDRDYEDYLGFEYISPLLIRTETHDLESYLIKSKAFDKMLIEYSVFNKRQKFLLRVNKLDLRNVLTSASKIIGYYRLLSLKNNFRLKFNGLNFNDFIDPVTLNLKEDKLLISLIHNTNNSKLKSKQLKDRKKILIRNIPINLKISWLLVNGHDMMQILLIGLLNIFGSINSDLLSMTHIERILRASLEFAEFKNSDIYTKMIAWASKNDYNLFLYN